MPDDSLKPPRTQGSVRHILSLYAAFVKVPRKITDPGTWLLTRSGSLS